MMTQGRLANPQYQAARLSPKRDEVSSSQDQGQVPDRQLPITQERSVGWHGNATHNAPRPVTSIAKERGGG
jgi:hypothetical protein